MSAQAALYCLDCGQGSCQVLVLPGRRGVVFDCGGNQTSILSFLDNWVDTIEHIFVTHLDQDHRSCLLPIIQAYSDSPNPIKVWLFEDRPSEKLPKNIFIRLCTMEQSGTIRLNFLLVRDDPPEQLAMDNSTGIRYCILHPRMPPNIAAKGFVSRKIIPIGQGPNATSALLKLSLENHHILFGADLDLKTWEYLLGSIAPHLTAHFFVFPHHGAPRDDGVKKKKQIILHELLDKVNCKVAFVSVGTGNKCNHPDRECICLTSKRGISVCCSEANCVVDAEEVVQQPKSYPQSPGVPCIGTLRVDISNAGIRPVGIVQHKRAIDSSPVLQHSAYCRQ